MKNVTGWTNGEVGSPFVECFQNENGTIAIVEGRCMPECNGSLSMIANAEPANWDLCMAKYRFKHDHKSCNYFSCEEGYRPKQFTSKDAKKGLYCDDDGEWIVNVECEDFCDEHPNNQSCQGDPGEECQFSCGGNERDLKGKFSGFAKCVAKPDGKLSWSNYCDIPVIFLV